VDREIRSSLLMLDLKDDTLQASGKAEEGNLVHSGDVLGMNDLCNQE